MLVLVGDGWGLFCTLLVMLKPVAKKPRFKNRGDVSFPQVR